MRAALALLPLLLVGCGSVGFEEPEKPDLRALAHSVVPESAQIGRELECGPNERNHACAVIWLAVTDEPFARRRSALFAMARRTGFTKAGETHQGELLIGEAFERDGVRLSVYVRPRTEHWVKTCVRQDFTREELAMRCGDQISVDVW